MLCVSGDVMLYNISNHQDADDSRENNLFGIGTYTSELVFFLILLQCMMTENQTNLTFLICNTNIVLKRSSSENVMMTWKKTVEIFNFEYDYLTQQKHSIVIF